jgi:hypothetical protein
MNSHLSDVELTNQLLGIPSEAAEIHLELCPVCRRELEQMRESIQVFRAAAIDWSESQRGVVGGSRPRASARLNQRRVFALGAMTAALIALIVVAAFQFRYSRLRAWVGSPTSGMRESAQTVIARDNELLSQVNTELSETVAVPMQPLQISLSSEQNSH